MTTRPPDRERERYCIMSTTPNIWRRRLLGEKVRKATWTCNSEDCSTRGEEGGDKLRKLPVPCSHTPVSKALGVSAGGLEEREGGKVEGNA